MPICLRDISTGSSSVFIIVHALPEITCQSHRVRASTVWTHCRLSFFVCGVLVFSAAADAAAHINYQEFLPVLKKKKKIGSVKCIFSQIPGGFRAGKSTQYISMQFVHSVQSLHLIPSLWQNPQLRCQSFVREISSRLEWDFLIGKHRRRDLLTNRCWHSWVFSSPGGVFTVSVFNLFYFHNGVNIICFMTWTLEYAGVPYVVDRQNTERSSCGRPQHETSMTFF